MQRGWGLGGFRVWRALSSPLGFVPGPGFLRRRCRLRQASTRLESTKARDSGGFARWLAGLPCISSRRGELLGSRLLLYGAASLVFFSRTAAVRCSRLLSAAHQPRPAHHCTSARRLLLLRLSTFPVSPFLLLPGPSSPHPPWGPSPALPPGIPGSVRIVCCFWLRRSHHAQLRDCQGGLSLILI